MSNSPKTLLQIVNAAQNELGLTASSSVAGNTTDASAVQMLSLLNQGGEELRDTPESGWTAMQAEFNLVINVPIITTGNTALNSAVLTNIPSTAGITANNWVVTGASIPVAARVKSVDSLTQITMTMQATGAPIPQPRSLLPKIAMRCRLTSRRRSTGHGGIEPIAGHCLARCLPKKTNGTAQGSSPRVPDGSSGSWGTAPTPIGFGRHQAKSWRPSSLSSNIFRPIG